MRSTALEDPRLEHLRQRAIRESSGPPPDDVGDGFEIQKEWVDLVRKVCAGMHESIPMNPPFPLMLEYAFDADVPEHGESLSSLALDIKLRAPDDRDSTEVLRPYQQTSLSKMFTKRRARSGMIVLPCGAGKTLVGIAACATIRRNCVILCPNLNSVNQWEGQIRRYTECRSPIVKLTSEDKEKLDDSRACILITTYTMLTSRGTRSDETQQILDQIRAREWGLMVLDETHQVMATTFQAVFALKTRCRLGLTATLVREDGKERELAHMIGPKLYEANWMDLTRAGFLANVQVVEIACPMSPEFYETYLRGGTAAMVTAASASSAPSWLPGGSRTHAFRKALSIMNPNKAVALQKLLRYHVDQKDKIIVFSDNVFVLTKYARDVQGMKTEGGNTCHCMLIYGETANNARAAIINTFRSHDTANILFLSKVGDVALDVPDANVIIQISAHYGSRLQEAQRLGRILRPKTSARAFATTSTTTAPGSGGFTRTTTHFHSFFYTLVSQDTEEVFHATRRRRYLADQGYAYKMMPLFTSEEGTGLGTEAELRASAHFLGTLESRVAFLQEVISNSSDILNEERKEDRKLGEEDPIYARELRASEARGAQREAHLDRLMGHEDTPTTRVVGGARRTVVAIEDISGGGSRYQEYTATSRGSLPARAK